MSNSHSQKIYLSELDDDAPAASRKASRIELRTLRDAYSLKTDGTNISSIEKEETEENLRRMTAYCTAEAYNLKNLYQILKEHISIDKIQMYFGEGIHAVYKEGESLYDIYFMHYGAVVMWGLEEEIEMKILKIVSRVEEGSYDLKSIEVEKIKYGLSKHSQIVNDKILLSDDNAYIKMVISIAIAQSVKLDYFEELVENTIETVRDLPDEVEKEGKVGKKRKDILKIIGRLHKLNFHLYLVSNILGEPEFIWEYSSFSPLYETCIRYFDIKRRADLLNKQCDTIHGILEILSENITTHNSEKLETAMTLFIGISAICGFLQCGLIVGLFVYLTYFK